MSFLDSNDEAIIQQDRLADAVITGLRDYCLKSGLNKIVLGLSGGIDSAVAAVLLLRLLAPKM